MTSKQLKFMEELWKKVGISADQTDASMAKFAQNLDQLQKRRGDFMKAFTEGKEQFRGNPGGSERVAVKGHFARRAPHAR